MPSTYIIDNEASKELKHCIVKNKLSYQLTLPHMHRINAAEHAICTFKNHFLAGLATIDPKFPIREWLLPQAEATLNMLRNTRLHPHCSAYEVMNGPFDFTKTSLAPPGTKVNYMIRAQNVPHGHTMAKLDFTLAMHLNTTTACVASSLLQNKNVSPILFNSVGFYNTHPSMKYVQQIIIIWF